jgi:hypothetical protein
VTSTRNVRERKSGALLQALVMPQSKRNVVRKNSIMAMPERL